MQLESFMSVYRDAVASLGKRLAVSKSPSVNQVVDQTMGYQSVTRPSLAYQHAFDLCASAVHATSLAPVVLASGEFYTREFVRRLSMCQTRLVPVAWQVSFDDLTRLLEGEVEMPELVDLSVWNGQTRAIIWAEPDLHFPVAVLGKIRRLLLPGGRLYVVVSGGLAGALPEWQEADRQRPVEGRPAPNPAGLLWTLKHLRRSGFTIESVYGFHSPRSIFWSLAQRIFSFWGRDDVADRCHFRMRADYVVQGVAALWTPVAVVWAKKVVDDA